MRRFTMVSGVLLIALSMACVWPDVPWREMRQLYAEAARDAARAEPTEVVTDLPVLEPGSEDFVWEGPGERILGTVWIERAGRFEGEHTVPLEDDLWIVPAPRLRDFCREIDTGTTELRLRLEQLLGLPPQAGRGRKMVQVWVDPVDVFRPCPDPEVTDDHCDVHAPVGADHQAWFSEQEARGRTPDGRLWTRLGYTYDWGDPYTEVGLAELVVPAGTVVGVERVVETGRFCATSPP